MEREQVIWIGKGERGYEMLLVLKAVCNDVCSFDEVGRMDGWNHEKGFQDEVMVWEYSE